MDRMLKSALLSLLFNLAFGAYHIALGLTTHSQWLFTVGIYYVILGIIRFAVISVRGRDCFVLGFTGSMLMILSFVLGGTVVLATVRDRGIVFHEIVMIAIAVYAFTKITVAIVNMIKLRRNTEKKTVALRSIAFSEACASIFALQRSMLVSFEGMSGTDIRIMNAATGCAVCVIVFLLGLNLVRNQRLAKMKEG